jgi:hypothetical protein
MKKRWLIYLVLLILSLNLVTAMIESHNTQAKSLLLIDKPDVALVNSDFKITAKYYFTNQQVIEVEISFVRDGKLVQKNTYMNTGKVEVSYDLNEKQVATYPYAIFVKERLEGGTIVDTGIDISMNVISNDIEAVKSRHEIVMVSGSDQLYFDDVSVYEPYALRDKMEYSIIQENPTKVACTLDGSIITFASAEDWTGRSTCTVKGAYNNISLIHTYDLLVMANKALYIKDLSEVYLNELFDGKIVYENITDFCNYQFEPNQKPYVYLASDNKGFVLQIEGKDLVIHNITRNLTGKHLVRLGCNDQFREFYLNVKEREFNEFEISLSKTDGKDLLDFGIGTLSLDVPEQASIGEKNFAEVIVNIDNPELHPFDRAFLFDLDLGVEFQEKECSEYPCTLKFEIFNPEKGIKHYAIIVAFENRNALDFERLEDDYYINSSGTSFVVHKIFDVEFTENKPDALAHIRNDLGIIKPPLTAESELAMKDMLELSLGKIDLDIEKQRLEKTFELIEVSKIMGTSTTVNELGERLDNSVIKIIITPKKRLSSLVVYEYIPKVNAESIGNVEFYNAVLDSHEGSFQIIEPDPLIAWHFEELDDAVELKYELSRQTDISGNTIIIAEAAEETSNSWYTALVLVFIVVLVLLMLFFYMRFRKKHPGRNEIKKEISEEVDDMEQFFKEEEHDFESILGKEMSKKVEARERLKQAAHYVEHRLKAGHKKDDIVLDLLNKGWPTDIVDKLLERFER